MTGYGSPFHGVVFGWDHILYERVQLCIMKIHVHEQCNWSRCHVSYCIYRFTFSKVTIAGFPLAIQCCAAGDVGKWGAKFLRDLSGCAASRNEHWTRCCLLHGLSVLIGQFHHVTQHAASMQCASHFRAARIRLVSTQLKNTFTTHWAVQQR